MKHSTDRILTTHCGSLARPKDLLDLMKAKLNGEAYDRLRYANHIGGAVAQTVREQARATSMSSATANKASRDFSLRARAAYRL